jgi:hypothetical protein
MNVQNLINVLFFSNFLYLFKKIKILNLFSAYQMLFKAVYFKKIIIINRLSFKLKISYLKSMTAKV